MLMNSIGITMIVMAGLYFIWFKYRAVLREQNEALPE